jgi:hypothetical protein
MAKNTVVTGLFKNQAVAETAVERLMGRGYSPNDISVLLPDRTRTKEVGLESKNQAAKGAGIGGAVGGTLGAALAGIAAVGTSLVVPGLGLVVAGPIAAALAGAGAGGATGGLVGMLVGAGVPEHRAKVYDSGLREGGILVGVEPKSEHDTKNVEDILNSTGADDVRKES